MKPWNTQQQQQKNNDTIGRPIPRPKKFYFYLCSPFVVVAAAACSGCLVSFRCDCCSFTVFFFSYLDFRLFIRSHYRVYMFVRPSVFRFVVQFIHAVGQALGECMSMCFGVLFLYDTHTHFFLFRLYLSLAHKTCTHTLVPKLCVTHKHTHTHTHEFYTFFVFVQWCCAHIQSIVRCWSGCSLVLLVARTNFVMSISTPSTSNYINRYVCMYVDLMKSQHSKNTNNKYEPFTHHVHSYTLNHTRSYIYRVYSSYVCTHSLSFSLFPNSPKSYKNDKVIEYIYTYQHIYITHYETLLIYECVCVCVYEFCVTQSWHCAIIISLLIIVSL